MARNVINWEQGHGTTAEMAEGPNRNYKYLYFATLRHVSVDPFYIFTYSKCPQLGKGHQYDGAAYCHRVKVSQVGASKVYKVDVEFTTDIQNPSNDPNPLKRPAIIDITGFTREVPTVLDGRGLPILNTAGDLQVVMAEKPFQNFRIKKNVPKVPDWFFNLAGTTNKYAIEIEGRQYAPRTMKLLAPSRPDKVLENGKSFYSVEFNLEFNFETWDEYEPSRGFHELIPQTIQGPNGPETKLVKKRITIGTPPEYPKEKQFLDKNGRAILLEPDKKGGIDLSKIHIQQNRRLREVDLSVIPLK